MSTFSNVGSSDRIVRIAISTVLIIAFFLGYLPEIWGIVGLIVAGVLLLTSFAGFCPLYSIFRANTRKPSS